MKIGLIGLEKSGKTTIFNALTGSEEAVNTYTSQKVEPHLAVVEVMDPRVTRLKEMYKPKKTIYATIEFFDFAGLTSGSSMGLVKTSDALALVIRNFSNDILDETLGKPDPRADLDNVRSELILSDLIITENRLERIEADCKRGKKTPELQKEEKVLRKAANKLNEDKLLRELDLTDDELKTISGFQFLSLKPLLVILNSDETCYGNNQGLLDELSGEYDLIEFAGGFEMELSRLEPEEAEFFMQDMGIETSAKERLTRFAYDMLGYISFFTVGEDEVRAWTLHKGETAVDAAGTIHSDLARGFIRAECFSYDDLIEAGSEKGVKDNVHFRLEGKNYTLRDGDIINVRFSI